jgi:hypothetical protein
MTIRSTAHHVASRERAGREPFDENPEKILADYRERIAKRNSEAK